VTKIACDPSSEGIFKRISDIRTLEEKYGGNIDIRFASVTYGTSRRVIYDNMAIDGRRLAIAGDLAYVSTIYFQKSVIERMRDNYDRHFETYKPC